MDTVTAIAMSIDNPIVKAVGVLLQNSFIYVGVILALILIGESRNEKRKKIILSIALAALLTLGIKYAMVHERPCVGEEWCPGGYSFPSLHAAVAFTLMIAFLDKRRYPFYLLFALFVGFTRLNLGVHVFQDVVAALPIAMLSYYITYIVWEEIEK